MGKQGVSIESGCCRSSGRVAVMVQSEYGSTNEALVIQAQGRPFGPQNLNQTKHCMRHSMLYHIRYDAQTLRCVAQNIRYRIRWEHMTLYVMTYDVICLTDIVVSDIVWPTMSYVRHRRSWPTMSCVTLVLYNVVGQPYDFIGWQESECGGLPLRDNSFVCSTSRIALQCTKSGTLVISSFHP